MKRRSTGQSEAFGASELVKYSNATKQIYRKVKSGSSTNQFNLQLFAICAISRDRSLYIDHLMVSLRFLALALGATVEAWPSWWCCFLLSKVKVWVYVICDNLGFVGSDIVIDCERKPCGEERGVLHI